VRRNAACWIDRHHDREAGDADDGRFAAHVRAHADDFNGCWGDISPVGFACTAWWLATAPSLDPGYVRFHRRVLTASCDRSEWDGSLLARAWLVAPKPDALTRTRSWDHDRGWRDWAETFGQFNAPNDQDLIAAPYLRTVVLVDAGLPLDLLPAPPDAPTPRLPQLAARTVEVIVAALNDLLAPVLAALEAGPPPD
jgi:hypothetical protein